MLDFNYLVDTKIFFGRDRLDSLGPEIKKYADRVLIVYGRSSIKQNGIYQKIVKILEANNIFYKELSGVRPNPRIKTVREGVALCRENNLGFVLAVGGGSVIDCAKAVACGTLYDQDPWDFFSKQTEIKQALALGTVLTLAASGSEMNGYSVISNEQTQEKLAAGSDILRPKFSVLDPEVMFNLPKEQTAAGVVDIYVHVIEQYFSSVSGAFLQDRLAEAIFKTCLHYGSVVMNEPKNYQARANIMWASSLALCGLLSYGKIGDWSTHAIEHAVSAVYDVTHGVGLAIIVPFWMNAVLNETTVDKFAEYAINVWGLEGEDKFALAKQSIKKTREFFDSLAMPKTLREVGVKESELSLLVSKAMVFGPIGTFKKLETLDVLGILKAAF
ncbi:MAG: iron-containing alcohol dehydrogenase [Candidatus Omnitrophica bacterium]|nr:iron-containing alcohol dehydrogenase [Candidatus Omnitrophota bacterium]